MFLVRESGQDYLNITKPYIQSIPEESTLWVRNIIEHKQEVERIIYEDLDYDKGFMLLPDFKWDGKRIEFLYCLGMTLQLPITSNISDSYCNSL